MPIEQSRQYIDFDDKTKVESRLEWAELESSIGIVEDELRSRQLRMIIVPEAENMQRAANAIKATLRQLEQESQGSEVHWPGLKICMPQNVIGWDGTMVTAGADRDQRGKELCIYLSHDGGKFPFPPEYVKHFMLTLWRQMELCEVETNYTAPPIDEYEVRAGVDIATPFFLGCPNNYKTTDKEPYMATVDGAMLEYCIKGGRYGLLHSYAPTPLPVNGNPLEGVKITISDMNRYGIQDFDKTSIAAKRARYQLNHYRVTSRILRDSYKSLIENTEGCYPEQKRYLETSILESKDSSSVGSAGDIPTYCNDVIRAIKEKHWITDPTEGQRAGFDDIGLFKGFPRRADSALSLICHGGELLHYIGRNDTEKVSQILRDAILEADAEIVKIKSDYAQHSHVKEMLGIASESELELLIENHPHEMQALFCRAILLYKESLAIKNQLKVLRVEQRYENLWDSNMTLQENARKLLLNYTKNYSTALRLFSLRWDRHYVEDVTSILNSEVSLSDDEFIDKLVDFSKDKGHGSLVSRCLFIIDKSIKEDAYQIGVKQVASDRLGS